MAALTCGVGGGGREMEGEGPGGRDDGMPETSSGQDSEKCSEGAAVHARKASHFATVSV